nr:transposase, MuDR, MULE transposase domain protein [Tanacetum cinerariifolium]
MKRKPQTEAQARKNMMMYLMNVAGFKLDYFKGMSYDDIRPIFEAKFNSNVDFLLKTKEQMEEEENIALQKINETPAEKAAKRRKLNEEVEDLKRHLKIVPDEDDDVYTEETPLARKVPVMDYEIIELNNKPYYKIIRADGTHQLYISFLTLLKNFDREDLEALWNLVKEMFSTSKPKNFFDDFLLTTLEVMFEKLDAHAQIWKNQRIMHGQAKLPYYCHNLELTNDDTITHIETDEKDRFKMVFIAFGVVIRSFKYHMRPLIIIDATHLKRRYEVTNLLVVGMDGNNQIIPIATCVSQESVCKDGIVNVGKHIKLPYYCHNLELTNDDTITHIETDEKDRFKMVFIAFGVVIRSFKYHMRPLIIIDATHLKRRYEVTNLLVVGMDGNNQIIPIATCVSQGETGPSCTWFLSKLKECIGEIPNLTIISDRHVAILSSCEAVFPNAFHGYCCRHLMMSCKLKSIKMQVYEVDNHRRMQTVELCNGTCRKWQVSGLPCGHVLAICRIIGLTDCHRLAKGWFMRIAFKGTYQELVYHVGEVSSWQIPNYLLVVKPPHMDKQPTGRPKSTKHIRSQGEEPVTDRCGRYGAHGHNRQGCRETISFTKERTYPRGSSQQADDYLPQSMPWSFDAVNLDDP